MAQRVVQAMMLFGAGAWVLARMILGTLEGVHRSFTWRIAGRKPTLIRATGGWIYPPTDEVIEDVGLLLITDYIARRQGRVDDCAATRPVLNLCIRAGRPEGSRVGWWCWWD